MVAYATTRRRRLAAKAAENKLLRRRMPPSANLINTVLECADLRDDMGGGRVMLRLSPMRLASAAVRRALGDEAERAGDVAVIWDEREDEIFRVLDGGAPPLAVVADQPNSDTAVAGELEGYAFDPDEDEPQFELTQAALRYLDESASRRRW